MDRRTMLLATLSALSTAAMAQEPHYSNKPVRIIVPTAPSGGVDLLARLVAQKLSERMGEQFYVDNHPGAAGMIGTRVVASSAPDGYTLLMAPSSIAVTSAIKTGLPYDLRRDLTPIMMLAQTPYAFIVNPKLPVHSIKELVAYAKAHPGEINLGSTGYGSTSHLAADLFSSMTGIKMTHVPNKGMGPAMNDVMSGVTSLLIGGLPPALAAAKSGRLRVLAVASAERSELMPDLPTAAEAGVPGFEVNNWIGLLAPAGLDSNLVQRLHDEVLAIINDPVNRKRLIAGGFEPGGSTPEIFRKQLRSDIQKWQVIAQRAGLTQK